jgi:Domain of Unknown Function (DUF1080)
MTQSLKIAATILAFLRLAAPAPASDDVRLFEGDNAGAIQLVGIGPDSIKVVAGEIRLTGKPNGYFATKGSYTNYVLTFDWMYERPDDLVSDAHFRGNSGLLLHIQPPHKVWPRCVEVQLQNASAGAVIPVGGAQIQGKRLSPAQAAVKPVGQWNHLELVSRDRTLVCTINGVDVSEAVGSSVEGGSIGWQSEGAPIRFRNVSIRERP